MLNSQTVQYLMMIATSLLFGAAFVLGLQHMRRTAAMQGGMAAGAGSDGGGGGVSGGGLPHEASMGVKARSAVFAATLLGMGLFIWRAVSEHSFALPVSNPFDAFLVLGLLLALIVMYFRWTRHLRSFSFFLLPMIVILLLLGVVLAVMHPSADRDNLRNTWTYLHVVTVVAGTLCFALGCVGGIVYLLADRQLRRKGLDQSHRWVGFPPLASIEKFNQWMVYVGFPLLTISTFAGILRIAQAHEAAGGAAAAGGGVSQAVKIASGSLSWAVYAVLLHVPLNPRLRGKRAAWLSILGFVLFIGAFIAARWN